MPKKKLNPAFAAAVLACVWLASFSTTAQAATSDSSPMNGAVAKLFVSVVEVMARLGGPLGLSDAELAKLVGAAYEELDPKTGAAYRSAKGNPVPYFVFEPEHDCADSHEPPRTVLFLGGVHADEVSPLYTSFHAALELLLNPRRRPPNTRVIYVPLVNPDGLLHVDAKGKPAPTRTNHNAADLNRDFLSQHPEIETRFVSQIITVFRPTHIVSLHGPYGWVDYDGPDEVGAAGRQTRSYADQWVGRAVAAGRKHLPVNSGFGTYGGSLGAYGGGTLRRHVMTIEYPHEAATTGPTDWVDYGDTVIEALNPGVVPSAEVLPGYSR